MMQADEQQPAAQSSHESSEGGSQGTGDGRRGRRRRGRGRRGGEGQPRPGHDATGSADAPEQSSEQSGTDRQDADRPTTSGSDAAPEGGSEQERSKRKRRRKKKSGQSSGDAVGATDDTSSDDAGDEDQSSAEAAPAGQQKQQQQPRQQQQRTDRRRDEKGGEEKERAPRGSVLQRRTTRGDYDDTPKVKDEPAPMLAPINAINVDAYIGHFKGWQREVLTTLRAIIRQGAGDIDESILWSQPVFSSNGPVCYIKAFSDHVNFRVLAWHRPRRS
jgi:hypothetical protein